MGSVRFGVYGSTGGTVHIKEVFQGSVTTDTDTTGIYTTGTYSGASFKFTVSNPRPNTGYSFGGWSDGTSSSTTTKSYTTYSGGSADLLAVFNKISYSYTIKYNSNGGSGTMSDVSAKSESTTKLKACEFSRTGATFSNWNTRADGTGNVYTPDSTQKQLYAGESLSSGSTITLYAIWNETSYSVQIDTCGGTPSSFGDYVTYSQGYSPHLTPTKTGYALDGYYTAASGGTRVTFPYHPTSDVVFYAHWTPVTYYVSFNGNGSTSGSMANQTRTYNDGAQLNANLYSRTGHSFRNWNTNAGGSGTSYSDRATGNLSSTSGATVSLYAQWSIHTYVVTYDANGGSGAPSSQTWNYGVAQNVSSTVPVRQDYTFKGWATSKTATTAQFAAGSSQTFTPSSVGEAHTWYAVWERIVCTVTFDYQGGSIGIASKTVNSGDQMGALPSTVQQGAQFAGWWTEASGGTQYTSTSVVRTNPLALYAHWTGNPYTIHFDCNGGSAKVDVSTHVGEIVTVTPPEREHYMFYGWTAVIDSEDKKIAKFSLSSDFSTIYSMKSDIVAASLDNQGVSHNVYFRNLTTTSGATVTLVARWCRIFYGIDIADTIDGDTSSVMSCSDTAFDDINLGYSSAYPPPISVCITTDPSFSIPITKEEGSSSLATCYAGCSYTVTTTCSDNITSGRLPVVKKWGGYDTSCTENGVFVATHTFADNETRIQDWTPTANYLTVAVHELPGGQTVAPTITRSYNVTDGQWYVKVLAGQTGALELDSWSDGVQTTPENPWSVQIEQDKTVTATFKLKRMNISVGVEAKSLAAHDNEMTESTLNVYVYQNDTQAQQKLTSISVGYGESVYFKIDGVVSTDPLNFDGWYIPGGSRASVLRTFMVTNVTSDITLQARFNAAVTIAKEIAESAQNIKAHLVLNGTSYEGASANQRLVIGEKFSIGVVEDNEDTVFANWYRSTDTSRTDPLLYEKMQSDIELLGTTSLKAYLINQKMQYYVAIRNYNVNVPEYETTVGSLGEVTLSSTGATSLTKAEYCTAMSILDPTSIPNGYFFKFIGTQRASIGIVPNGGTLSYLRLQRSKYSPESYEALTTETTLTTIVNQDFVYRAEWGTMERTYIKASLAGGSEVRAQGYVDLGSGAYGKSGDGTYVTGGYEAGALAEVYAYPYNGYRFSGWYWDAAFTVPITEGTASRYAFTVPALFSASTVYSSGALVSYAPPAAQNEEGTRKMYRCVNPYGHFGPWSDSDFAEAVMYAKFVTESIALYRWEGGQDSKTMIWKSKVYALSKPSNINSARIDSTGYTRIASGVPVPSLNLRLASFSSPDEDGRSGDTLATTGINITNQTMRKLPARRPERFFQVTVQNCHEIDAVILGTSGEGLAT